MFDAIFRRAALAEELSMLKQVNEFSAKGLSPPRGKNGFARSVFFFFRINIINLLIPTSKILAFSNKNTLNMKGQHLSLPSCF